MSHFVLGYTLHASAGETILEPFQQLSTRIRWCCRSLPRAEEVDPAQDSYAARFTELPPKSSNLPRV